MRCVPSHHVRCQVVESRAPELVGAGETDGGRRGRARRRRRWVRRSRMRLPDVLSLPAGADGGLCFLLWGRPFPSLLRGCFVVPGWGGGGCSNREAEQVGAAGPASGARLASRERERERGMRSGHKRPRQSGGDVDSSISTGQGINPDLCPQYVVGLPCQELDLLCPFPSTHVRTQPRSGSLGSCAPSCWG